jgi:small-conductance mechanosensitive channel
MTTLAVDIPEAAVPWLWTAGPVLAAIIIALIVHAILYSIANRITRRTTGVADTSAVTNTRGAARLLGIVVAMWLVLPGTPLKQQGLVGEAAWEGIDRALDVALIAAMTWLIIRSLSIIDDVIMARHRLDVADNLEARRLLTQARVLSRSAMIIVGLVGFAAILMTFPSIREFGASLLASAGIAGIVVGLAARPTLANLIAGIQLALTQPIRLDDVVIVEGEWGRVEEIRPTYVVVRIWDKRRLIVPLEYFINQPFQNWTRRAADILGTVHLYADYTVPVDAVRAELERIVKASGKWDGEVCSLSVTNTSERAVELRALMSAANSSDAWDLRCMVREQLIGYLQREHPGCLPKTRADVRSDGHLEALPAQRERQERDDR